MMDYKNKYIRDLQKLIIPLEYDIRNEIYYDLIKLPDWNLPKLEELELYFSELDWDINHRLWKFIYLELTSEYHHKLRNNFVIYMIKMLKDTRIKPFVIHYVSVQNLRNLNLLNIPTLMSMKKFSDKVLERYEKYTTEKLFDIWCLFK